MWFVVCAPKVELKTQMSGDFFSLIYFCLSIIYESAWHISVLHEISPP